MMLLEPHEIVLHAFNGGPSDVWPIPDRVVRLRKTVGDVYCVPRPRVRASALPPPSDSPMECVSVVRVQLRTLKFRPFVFCGWWVDSFKQKVGWDEATRTLVVGPPPEPVFAEVIADLNELDFLRSLWLMPDTVEAAR